MRVKYESLLVSVGYFCVCMAIHTKLRFSSSEMVIWENELEPDAWSG